MKIDQYGELVSEIWPDGEPGNLGNCMAETARWDHLYFWQFKETDPAAALLGFRTDTSYRQSLDPACPPDWKVSSDQCLPWFLAVSTPNSAAWVANEMVDRFKAAGWRTPDGNFVSPGFFCLLKKWRALFNLCALVQVLIFKLPWRWDDGQKKLVSSAGSSADYLNWFHYSLYCWSWVRKLVPQETVLAKIRSYYEPEPNVQWLLDLYQTVADKEY